MQIIDFVDQFKIDFKIIIIHAPNQYKKQVVVHITCEVTSKATQPSCTLR